MVYLAIILLVVSALLIVTEVLVPGFAVFGVLGVICFIASCIVTAIFVPYGLFWLLAEIVTLLVMLYGAYTYLRKNQLDGKLILTDVLESETREFGDLEHFLGFEGITKTSLRPFGSAEFNGNAIDVYSDGEYINEHERVKVIKVAGDKVYVKKVNSN